MKPTTKKQMTIGAFFSYLAVAARLLSGVLYTPIILSALGKSEYGIYSLCLSFTGYLTIFNAGMNAAYVRFYVQAKETGNQGLKELNGTFLKIFTMLGLIGMIVGLLIGRCAPTLFGSKIRPAEYAVLQRSFYVLAFTIFLTSVNGIFNSAIIAHERFVVGKLVDLLYTILAPVVTIPFLLGGYGSVTILVVQMCLTALMLLFNALYSVKTLGMSFELKGFNRLLFQSVAIFGAFIAIQSVMDQLNWQVDKLILAKVRGADEVAVYSVGSHFNTYFLTIAAAVGNVFISQINKLVARREDKALSDLFIQVSRIIAQVSVLIMSGFIIFGKPFVCRWAGAGYENSYYIAILLMLPATVATSQWLGQDIARAKNLHKMQIIINVCVCLLNFLVSIPLAKMFGAIGSAVGTFACEIVISIFIQTIYYQKVVKLNMRAYYKEMLQLVRGWIIPFVAGAVLSIFGFIHDSYSSILRYGVLYVIIYGISVWCISLSDGEKGYVKSIISKIVK